MPGNCRQRDENQSPKPLASLSASLRTSTSGAKRPRGRTRSKTRSSSRDYLGMLEDFDQERDAAFQGVISGDSLDGEIMLREKLRAEREGAGRREVSGTPKNTCIVSGGRCRAIPFALLARTHKRSISALSNLGQVILCMSFLLRSPTTRICSVNSPNFRLTNATPLPPSQQNLRHCRLPRSRARCH